MKNKKISSPPYRMKGGNRVEYLTRVPFLAATLPGGGNG
jgi:hypothetical protein